MKKEAASVFSSLTGSVLISIVIILFRQFGKDTNKMN